MQRGPGRARWRAVVPPAVALVFVLLLGLAGGGAAGTQEELDADKCPSRTSFAVDFVGRVTAIRDEEVTFSVRDVRRGTVPSDTLLVRYPTKYNAGELEVGEDYLVPLIDVETGADALGEPASFVRTAELSTCSSAGTRHADGSPIDTGTLAKVDSVLPRYVLAGAAIVVAALVALVALGRFLDRRSRYTRPVRI